MHRNENYEWEGCVGQGSLAAPGYMRPEGVVMYLRATDSYYKSIIDK